MDTMICYECVMKHLANALSYGKEILSGHTKGAELDHRIDFLGELGNAEHHLELIDRNLFSAISAFRKAMQVKQNIPDPGDLEVLRKFFLAVEKRSEMGQTTSPFHSTFSIPTTSFRNSMPQGITTSIPCIRTYEKPLDIVFPKITNRDHIEFALKSIQKFAKGVRNLYFIDSEIDLNEFEIEKIDSFQDLKLGENFMYWCENMCLLREFNLQDAVPIYGYSTQKIDLRPIITKIRSNNKNPSIYLYDGLNPQPVNTKQFNAVLQEVVTDYPLTLYFNYIQTKPLYSAVMTTVTVDKVVCCSTRSRLKTCYFANWNEIAFESLKKTLAY